MSRLGICPGLLLQLEQESCRTDLQEATDIVLIQTVGLIDVDVYGSVHTYSMTVAQSIS